MISILIIIGFVILFLWGDRQSKRWIRKGKSPGLFYQIWPNAAMNFHGKYLFIFLLSIILTILIAASGLDIRLQILLQKQNPLGNWLPWFILFWGNFWPLGFALIPYLIGKIKGDSFTKGAGLAALHALFLNAFINTTEKLLSGRQGPDNLIGLPGPHHKHFAHTIDPLNFRFDFWNHTFEDGRFMWPSGHTASMFALVTALTVYFPQKKWIPWLGYPAALLTGIAMIDGDFHWTSDVVAGALLGTIAGHITGKSFRTFFQSSI